MIPAHLDDILLSCVQRNHQSSKGSDEVKDQLQTHVEMDLCIIAASKSLKPLFLYFWLSQIGAQIWMKVGVDDRKATFCCFRDELTAHFKKENDTNIWIWTLTKDSNSPTFKSNQCYILQSMGCVKSKRSDSASQNANSTEGKAKRSKGEKAYLVNSEMGSPEISPPINPVLLEYAHRLSEEIVARAVQQWVEVDRRYSDIPYIECDVPWHKSGDVKEEKNQGRLRRPWLWP